MRQRDWGWGWGCALWEWGGDGSQLYGDGVGWKKSCGWSGMGLIFNTVSLFKTDITVQSDQTRIYMQIDVQNIHTYIHTNIHTLFALNNH